MFDPSPQPTHDTRRSGRLRLLLLALLPAAFALRAWRLDAQSLWYDEGVTAHLARLPAAALTQWTANDIQPPLYYFAAAAWGRVAGWTEFALRFPSLWWGVLTVALLAAVARRWAAGRAQAVALAALFAAVHPMLIYYSQEARMYAQLAALGLLAGWCIGAALRRPWRWGPWIGYVAAGAAAAYTHYFAFFLLAAFSIGFLVEILLASSRPQVQPGRAVGNRTYGEAGRGRAIMALVLANAAVLLLYAPWLSALLTRLQVDASYWQGRLKPGEALRHVLISFVTGETVLEGQAVWLAALALLVVAAAALLTWRRVPALRPGLRFALLWAVVPAAAVILLAAFAPKFNARYATAAVPGVLLLAALALGGLIPAAGTADAARARRATLLAGAGAGLILLISLYAVGNWYWNGLFTKAQWRELAGELRSRLRPEEETVVLVSGHAWPVWEYYAPDMPAVRLPAGMDVLDVDRVLTVAEAAPVLRDAVETHPGVWLVQWQEEVVDPNDVVPVLLERAGREKENSALFSQLALRRFTQVKTDRLVPEPPIDVPLEAAFGGQVTLVGRRSLDNGDLLLFWRLEEGAPPDADLHLRLATTTPDGASVAQVEGRRLAGYTYPTFRWPRGEPGEIVMGRIPAAQWLGAPPQAGTYAVRLEVYDAATGETLPLANGETALVMENVEALLE